MPHVIERAATGRATCRGCGTRIAGGELRFGERLPNPYGDAGELTQWFHVPCAAYRRPEPFLEALAGTEMPPVDRERLEEDGKTGIAHPKLPRLSTAARAPSGRATCRSCREPIAKAAWRIALLHYDEGQFSPSGFIHARCATAYFEMTGVPPLLDRAKHFSPLLTQTELAEIGAELEPPGAGTA